MTAAELPSWLQVEGMSPGTLCLHSHVACVWVGECFARLGVILGLIKLLSSHKLMAQPDHRAHRKKGIASCIL